GLSVARCAELVGVDTKTVERWITRDRVPHRRHRVATADLLGVDETYLWPSVAEDQRTISAGRAELVEFYPSRSSAPAELWRSLIDQATVCVDVLVFAGLFLPEVQDISRLGERARQGLPRAPAARRSQRVRRTVAGRRGRVRRRRRPSRSTEPEVLRH